MPLGSKVPLIIPSPTFLPRRETPEEDGAETFTGCLWSWSRLGTGSSSGLPGMSPAVTVAMKQCRRRRLGSMACCSLQSGHGFRKGDSAREGSLLAPPLNCPCSHLGSQAVPRQGLENSKPRAWGFLLQPFLSIRIIHAELP